MKRLVLLGPFMTNKVRYRTVISSVDTAPSKPLDCLLFINSLLEQDGNEDIEV
jgi:hypothetical protein